jgi:hypothetical protein
LIYEQGTSIFDFGSECKKSTFFEEEANTQSGVSIIHKLAKEKEPPEEKLVK